MTEGIRVNNRPNGSRYISRKIRNRKDDLCNCFTEEKLRKAKYKRKIRGYISCPLLFFSNSKFKKFTLNFETIIPFYGRICLSITKGESDMIKYIKSFKKFIPTWIICIFMFFGILGWPFVVGVVLLIIQYFQRKKVKSEINKFNKENGNDAHSISDIEIERRDEQISKLKEELSEKDEQSDYLQKEILRLNYLARKQNEYIKKLSSEKSGLNKEELEKSDLDRFVLCAGKYKGGVDIPIGSYNLVILSGSGGVETNKPEDIYFRMESDAEQRKEYNWIEKYRNLEISEDTLLKISDGAKIEFTLVKRYDFSKETEEAKKGFYAEKTLLERELSTIKDEIQILNNQLIQKYYDFSDYDTITSQDCKNKLVLLKQKEHDLREQGKDVVIQYKYGRTNKTEQRIIRQMLRMFNCECDNIVQNISLKNIDTARRKIQNSFESINKLYLIDSAALRKDLLELKLEQATLMYTYELKYQQEKDIQKAIKEQMIEEAKVQREIEEQKKKIEKDLQQHLGEINRMMKYMQKTQIDAEKQLYMDKIKELEGKIKVLESDKETVVEREANAKAGFVYIISNIGSFGENIYKIGMTRRLEPMDRIHELSSASVPFEFDVHAMIFSSDAPELENTLHKHFADNTVNKVNPRKEFYNVNIDEIEKVVKENYNDTVQFTKIPIAAEYRQSLNMQ